MADENPSGYGQMHPEDTASDSNVTDFVIRQALAGMSTMKLVKVKAVGDNTVDVAPLVKLKDGSGNVTDQGTIFGIPLMQLQWGKNAVIGKPAVGDVGMLVCSDRDISAVKSTKDAAAPASDRKFSPADGVYIGGLLNGTPDQTIEFKDDGGVFSFKGGKKLEVSSSAGWEFTGKVTFNDVVVAKSTLQLAGAIQSVAGSVYDQAIHTSGAITADGTVSGGAVKAGAIDLAGHHHTAQGATAPTTPAQA